MRVGDWKIRLGQIFGQPVIPPAVVPRNYLQAASPQHTIAVNAACSTQEYRCMPSHTFAQHTS